MRMNRKFAAVAGSVALTGGLLAGGAGGASAAQNSPSAASDCPSGYYCVWSGENYTGHRQQVAGNNADLTVYSVFQNFKSWYNHGASCDFRWYAGKNYTGDSGVDARGTKGSQSAAMYIKSNKWVC
ncbi:peptidase inhibitor family I36 protein [Streptomyces humi]|uniref:peptidase inhibitor family I36 protein n=1 Tax=Streptomyces humi TaxID=1428620 RepID=UPI0006287A1D|nr:peptidase inhibitor family I36 protein [Streptomyces humi]